VSGGRDCVKPKENLNATKVESRKALDEYWKARQREAFQLLSKEGKSVFKEFLPKQNKK
jgi:hypothetical protein